MKITRRNVFFRLAYGHPLVNKEKIPKTTTLCKFFLRSLLGLIAWPLESMSIVVLVLIYEFCTFVFAGHWMHFTKDEDGAIFKPVWKLNKFPPIAWLVVAWLAYSFYVVFNSGLFSNVNDNDNLTQFFARVTVHISMFLVTCVIIIFIIGVSIVHGKQFINFMIERSSLVGTFIGSCKQKFCPVIEIEPEQDQLD